MYIGTDTRASSLLLGALFAAAPLRSAAMRFTARIGHAFDVDSRRRSSGSSVLFWFLINGPSSTWLFRGGLFVHSLLSALLVAGCAARPDAT